jgi:indole-3-glycerol phosphate synthase
MNNYLDVILQRKVVEVDALKKDIAENPDGLLSQIFYQRNALRTTLSFSKAISSGDQLAVIAEIKRRSPSKGMLSEITDPIQLAKAYKKGGAKAISILTDTEAFGGNLKDLSTVKNELMSIANDIQCPLLRKDFIIDRLQIAESLLHGADVILLIVKVLQQKTASLLDYAKQLGLEALVEVYNKDELKLALSSGATMIAVNNRELTTFTVDINRSFELINDMPADVVKVSASGIESPEQAQRLRKAGYDAVLVGEALVRAQDPGKLIGEMV